MKNKEKQIEDIGKILCGMKNGCDGCKFDKTYCNERNYAEEIYNAGYHKTSDVAREIFEDIEDFIYNIGYFDEFESLKKKYTEGGK